MTIHAASETGPVVNKLEASLQIGCALSYYMTYTKHHLLTLTRVVYWCVLRIVFSVKWQCIFAFWKKNLIKLNNGISLSVNFPLALFVLTKRSCYVYRWVSLLAKTVLKALKLTATFNMADTCRQAGTDRDKCLYIYYTPTA